MDSCACTRQISIATDIALLGGGRRNVGNRTYRTPLYPAVFGLDHHRHIEKPLIPMSTDTGFQRRCICIERHPPWLLKRNNVQYTTEHQHKLPYRKHPPIFRDNYYTQHMLHSGSSKPWTPSPLTLISTIDVVAWFNSRSR